MQLSEIKGQPQALQILQRAIIHQHVAHAYLFSGPEGVGKRTTALAFAQYLNCTNKHQNTLHSCEDCPSCIQTVSGNHPDLLVLDPDGTSIKIEQIRNLMNKAALRSYEGGYKVILINDAHTMTEQAANCLLKTLEEPVPQTVFILVTSQAQSLPVTILSRCQQIQFQLLLPPVVQELLMAIYPEKQSQIGLVTALAKGSVKTGSEILSNESYAAARNSLYELLSQLQQSSPSQILLWCEQWDKNKKMVKSLLELSQLWFHDLLLYVTANQIEYLVNQDYLAAFQRQHIQPDQLLQILKYYQTGLRQLESNASPKLVLEVALFQTQQAL